MKRMIRRLSEFQFSSSAVRGLLSIYYKEGKTYRVPFGAIKGQRLLYSHDLNFHMLLGIWEVRGARLLASLFREREFWGAKPTIVDVGANVGYMTLLLSKHVKRYSGKVVSFEASPDTFAILRRNIELNACEAVEIVQAAVADRDGTLDFYLSHHHHASSLVESWAMGTRTAAEKVMVPSMTLDSYFKAHPEYRPALIKMDIEGGGIHAIPGMMGVLGTREPLLFIESHTPEEDTAICSIVRDLGYSVFRLSDFAWATEPTQGYPNPNGVRGMVLLCPPRHLDRCKRLIFESYGVKS